MWEHEDYFGHGGPHLYDELIRVPLIIKPAASQGLAEGKTVRHQVRVFDIMPTLAEKWIEEGVQKGRQHRGTD